LCCFAGVYLDYWHRLVRCVLVCIGPVAVRLQYTGWLHDISARVCTELILSPIGRRFGSGNVSGHSRRVGWHIPDGGDPGVRPACVSSCALNLFVRRNAQRRTSPRGQTNNGQSNKSGAAGVVRPRQAWKIRRCDMSSAATYLPLLRVGRRRLGPDAGAR
jgi:hypothetical protein